MEDILVSLAKGEPLDMSKYKAVSETELSLAVSALIAENPSASQGVLMGKVMRHFNGRADGKKVQELIARAGVRQ